MHVELMYCTSWSYEPKAVSLTEKILKQYKAKIDELKLIPSDGGRFELSIDGDLVYSKLATGQFPDEEEIIDQIGKRVTAAAG